jgi:hypothetical protein
MCYGENGTVKFFETLADNVFRHNYSMMQIERWENYLHRGHSIVASYQVSVHLAKRFQRRIFLKIGQSETRIACGGHVW